MCWPLVAQDSITCRRSRINSRPPTSESALSGETSAACRSSIQFKSELYTRSTCRKLYKVCIKRGVKVVITGGISLRARSDRRRRVESVPFSPYNYIYFKPGVAYTITFDAYYFPYPVN